jgi:uncharacterized repeat protein (TIGR01451 family)
VDASSGTFISFAGGAARALHADMGGSAGGDPILTYGIPYIRVSGSQPKLTVQFDVPEESDGVDHSTETSIPFYPIPAEAITQPHWVEGGQPGNDPSASGDRHILLVDVDNKKLYELFSVFYNGSNWQAYSGAFFDMNLNGRRPDGWTSADAAGLAILPGLIRYEEAFGTAEINHAFRFTVTTTNNYVYPASHKACTSCPVNAPPMGARFRLKPGTNISGFAPHIQRILRAMKSHGLIVADNGSNMFITGTYDPRWDQMLGGDTVIDGINQAFSQIHASDFEVVRLGYQGIDLSLTNTDAPDPVPAGGTVTYTLTATNNQDIAASGVTITDPLPPGATFQSASPGCVNASGTVTCTIGALGAGAVATRTISVTASTPGTLTNTASVQGDQADPVTANSTATATTTVTSPPSLSISDTTVAEGNSGSVNATFTVTLSATSSQTVTVNYATTAGTATANADFTPVSGVLTIPAGAPSGTILVPVLGDVIDEPNETFTVTLSSPVNATLADAQGLGTITDDDAPPTITIDDTFTTEGNAGTTPATFTVSLSAASSFTVQVSYATADSSATAPADYQSASGTLSFPPGTLTQPVVVQVVGDSAIETDETFQVDLTAPVNATVGDSQGIGTISDDDAPPLSSLELAHGSELVADFQGGGPDLYRLAQAPWSSYEVVVDQASGDAVPVSLQRLGADNVTVLQTGTPAGVGPAVSLRWENRTSGTTVNQHIRIASGGCTVSCGPDDTYRVRLYETTYAGSRFNNAGAQVTILILQNAGDTPVAAQATFWNAAGSLIGISTLTVGARQSVSVNTSTVPGLSGQSGALTVTHDGRYGQLAGKAVALEPSTGFAFDTPLVLRAH